MLVIQRKDNPLKVLRFGQVQITDDNPHPLGEFDPAVYACVELDSLPDGYEMEQPVSLNEQLATLFDGMPVDIQAAFWQTRVAVADALNRGKVDVAIAMVEAAAVPVAIKGIKMQLLAVLKGKA